MKISQVDYVAEKIEACNFVAIFVLNSNIQAQTDLKNFLNLGFFCQVNEITFG